MLITGRTKANQTKLDEADYESIRALAASLDQNPPPLATVDDIARLVLTVSDDEPGKDER